MAKWSGKTKGGLAGYKIFVFVIKYPGIRFAYFLLRFVALYFLLFSQKKAICYYFRTILGYSSIKTIRSIYQNYCLLGQVLIDKIVFISGCKNKFTFTFEGEHYLEQLARDGEGGLLIGAHMGNWEVAGHLLERIDVPVHVVMLEAEHERIKGYLETVMVKKNMSIIPIKDDYSHLYAINEALSRKELVAIHGDRFLPGTNTVTIDFMGHKAPFAAGPHYLASKLNVPVTYVVTVKDSATHYHFYASAPVRYAYPSNLKKRQEEMTMMVKGYASFLEDMVKKYPLQWFNYFPFWEAE
jgi:predicted LPLAT superfamily acyltransferase